MSTLSEIYGRIHERLLVQGISARAACERAGLHSDTIRSIRRSLDAGDNLRIGVSSRTLSLLAPVLGTTASWLMVGGGVASKPIGVSGPIVSGLKIIEWDMLASHSFEELEDESIAAPEGAWPGCMFGTYIKDNSMNRLSPAGSLVVVNRAEAYLLDGSYYLAIIDDEVLYRKWYGNPERLEPASTEDRFRVSYIIKGGMKKIIGRVVRSMIEL